MGDIVDSIFPYLNEFQAKEEHGCLWASFPFTVSALIICPLIRPREEDRWENSIPVVGGLWPCPVVRETGGLSISFRLIHLFPKKPRLVRGERQVRPQYSTIRVCS